MFVRCQSLQQEIGSLRSDLEFPIPRERAASDQGMSEQAPSIKKRRLDLEDTQHRASTANNFEECVRIQSQICDLMI